MLNAFEKLIKISDIKYADGEARIHVTMDKDHMNGSNTLHGGVISSLLDSACGYAGLSILSQNYNLIAVQLNINFTRVVAEGDLIVTAKVIKPGLQILHIESKLFNNEDVVIAQAQGTWLVQRVQQPQVKNSSV